MSTDGREYPELFADVADKIAAQLLACGLPAERAAEIGLDIAEHIRGEWGGQALYFPKGERFDLARRDAQIYNKFNGRNVEELAREYDLTVVHVYRIVKQIGNEQRRKRQPELF